jgi:hypothetical protein
MQAQHHRGGLGRRGIGAARGRRDTGCGVKLIATPAEKIRWEQGAAATKGVFGDVVMAMLVHPAAAETSACSSRAATGMDTRSTGKAPDSAVAPGHAGRTAYFHAVAQVSGSQPQRSVGAGGVL